MANSHLQRWRDPTQLNSTVDDSPTVELSLVGGVSVTML